MRIVLSPTGTILVAVSLLVLFLLAISARLNAVHARHEQSIAQRTLTP